MAECPECAAQVPLTDAVPGEILPCPECGADLEVVSLTPPTLALAPQEEEDWGE
jgi:alpha-aminoadipate carrier protein LysW